MPVSTHDAASWVQGLVLKARIDAMSEWRRDMDTRRDYYEGNQEADLTAAMSTVDFPKTHRNIRKVVWNFTRKVIDATAKVYWQPPARTLTAADGGELSTEDASVLTWADLGKRGSLDNVSRMVNRWTRLYMAEGVWTQYDATSDALRWVSVAPQDIHVVQNPDAPGDIGRAELVVIPLDGCNTTTTETATESLQWVALTQDESIPFWGRVTDSGAFIVDKWGEATPQLAGRIPVTMYFDRFNEGQLLPEGNTDLTATNLVINLVMTNLYHLQKMQAHGQPVLNSMFNYPAGFKAGPEEVVQIKDPNGSFRYETPGAQLPAVKDIVEYLMKSAATLNNLSPGAFSTEVNQLSGIAKKIEELPLIQFVAEQQSLYAAYETDLFEVSRAVWNGHARHDPIDESYKQVVTFVPLDFPSDPAADLDRDEREAAMGIVARWELIQKKHPEMTEKQARERLAQNLVDNKATANAASPDTGPTFNFGDALDVEEAEEAALEPAEGTNE